LLQRGITVRWDCGREGDQQHQRTAEADVEEWRMSYSRGFESHREMSRIKSISSAYLKVALPSEHGAISNHLSFTRR
jgi:hypothetical protein